MSTFVTKNLSAHEKLVFSLDLSTLKPYSDCFECHADLAALDTYHQYHLTHCPCGAVRWYVVPDTDDSIGTLSNYKPTTIISGAVHHEHEKEHVMGVGANMLTRIHVSVYGQYPDIEGYDVCFGGEGAGHVLMYATCWETVGGLPGGGFGGGEGGKGAWEEG